MNNDPISNKVSSIQKCREFTTCFNLYFVSPLKSGLLGFTVFFTIFILIKLFLYKFFPQFHTTINSNDIALSFIGFLCAFIMKASRNYKGDN